MNKLYSALLVVILLFISCAQFGTKIEIQKPEVFKRTEQLVVWPTRVYPMYTPPENQDPETVDLLMNSDPDFYDLSERLSREADYHLYHEIEQSNLFKIVDPDSVLKTIQVNGAVFDRFGPTNNWYSYIDQCSYDAVLVTDIYFGREGEKGINTYVIMKLFQCRTGAMISKIKFDTHWGKSYLFEQHALVTLPDAVKGAVNGLIKAYRQNQADDKSSN